MTAASSLTQVSPRPHNRQPERPGQYGVGAFELGSSSSGVIGADVIMDLGRQVRHRGPQHGVGLDELL